MIKYIFSFFLMTINLSAVFANDFEDEYDLELKDRIEKAKIENYQLSDSDLLIYLKDMFKYMPEEYDKLVKSDENKMKESLNNVRHYYSELGMSIPEQIKLFESSPEMKEFMAKTWFNDTVVVEYAEKTLLNLSKNEYQTIINAARKLISDREQYKNNRYRGIVITDDFPEILDFIKIESIRIYQNSCDIYLYKGIGSMKSIGFHISKDNDEVWNIYHFNNLESYDKHLIDVESAQ